MSELEQRAKRAGSEPESSAESPAKNEANMFLISEVCTPVRLFLWAFFLRFLYSPVQSPGNKNYLRKNGKNEDIFSSKIERKHSAKH